MYNLRRWKIVISNYQTPVCVNANLLPNLYVLAVCLHCFSIQLALDAGPPRFWQLCSLIDSIPVWHVKNPKPLESHFMCDSSCAPHYEGDASKPTDTNRPAANSPGFRPRPLWYHDDKTARSCFGSTRGTYTWVAMSCTVTSQQEDDWFKYQSGPVCVEYVCSHCALRGFPPDTPASSHSLKTCL